LTVYRRKKSELSDLMKRKSENEREREAKRCDVSRGWWKVSDIDGTEKGALIGSEHGGILN
jgi:hypothetical protein